MEYNHEWLQNTLETRRKAVAETIRRATLAELEQLGSRQFPIASDPWCERYNAFLRENPQGEFYLAQTPEGAEIVYCRSTGQGVWFMPGAGMGIVQPKGLETLAEIVATRRPA